MDFDIFANLAIGLFVLGVAAIMLYERSSPKAGTSEESKPGAHREK
jgi:hypothetical protein